MTILRSNLTDLAFTHEWERQAELGKCDGVGGAEYRRVFAEWCREGRPEGLPTFIAVRANLGPIADALEAPEFYELMQAYRTAPLFDQDRARQTFEAVKMFVRRHYTSKSEG